MAFMFSNLHDRDYLLNLISDFLSRTKHKSYRNSSSSTPQTPSLALLEGVSFVVMDKVVC